MRLDGKIFSHNLLCPELISISLGTCQVGNLIVQNTESGERR